MNRARSIEVSRAAAAVGGEREFLALLGRSGVRVWVCTGAGACGSGEVTGCAVALAGDTARAGQPG